MGAVCIVCCSCWSSVHVPVVISRQTAVSVGDSRPVL
jgi:hypothetical protein